MNPSVEQSLRGPFDGVLQIVRYNWSLYAAAIAGSAVVVALVLMLHPVAVVSWILLAGSAFGIFWLAASLAASHYIYDRSGLYKWDWIRDKLGLGPHRLVNVHCGLDESSVDLRRVFPEAELAILDIYDSEEMPERSIARARAEARVPSGAVKADYRRLPLETGSVDAVFTIFAAHELRRAAAKETFFREAWRVLQPGGRLLLVEHLRDAWNLAAFGPGAWHFFPRREWLRVAAATGFELSAETSQTVFVHALVFRRC